MNKLITASDVAKRDKKTSVAAWICDVSRMRVIEGKIATAWDGKQMGGEPVRVMVNNGRVLARCEPCNKHEYVSPTEPIFFCMECGNGNSGMARPVEFPVDWNEIAAALIARPIFPGPGLDEVQAMFRSRPVMRDLKRNWDVDIPLEQLRDENRNYGIGDKR
jgi:hypothetical protein